MSNNNPLANIMSKILQAEKIGKPEVHVAPYSKMNEKILTLMKEAGYVKDFETQKEERGGKFIVKLAGKINKCGVISPNFNVAKNKYEVYAKRYLPARDFGLIFVSTTSGIITHDEAKAKNLGGRLIGYCY